MKERVVHACMCVQIIDQPWMQELSVHWAWNSLIWPRLAGQQAPRIYLTPLPTSSSTPTSWKQEIKFTSGHCLKNSLKYKDNYKKTWWVVGRQQMRLTSLVQTMQDERESNLSNLYRSLHRHSVTPKHGSKAIPTSISSLWQQRTRT